MEKIWDDAGSGAHDDVDVWMIENQDSTGINIRTWESFENVDDEFVPTCCPKTLSSTSVTSESEMTFVTDFNNFPPTFQLSHRTSTYAVGRRLKAGNLRSGTA